MSELSTPSRQVVVKGLHKSFGAVKAVDGVEFSFRGGQIHGFIGPNGAGKTTTMRLIATLEEPDSGDILLDGRSLVDYPDELRPQIGFMPDYLETYRSMLVEEYLDFYARAFRLSVAHKRRRLADVVEFTGLGRLLKRPVTGLSKGERQRLSLGRVLISDPWVLILDEPAAGLDPRARIELRLLLQHLASRGKAILLSSHILSELSEMCDAATIIEAGRVRASGSSQEIRTRIESGVRVAVVLARPSQEEKARLERTLAELPEVVMVEQTPAGGIFRYEGEPGMRTVILARLLEQRFEVTDFHTVASDLEDAFLALTEGKGAG